MRKKKWNRVLAVLLMMVMSISLLSGCGSKSAEKEDAETITVYLWSTNLYEKYAPYIQEQLPDINVELSLPIVLHQKVLRYVHSFLLLLLLACPP